MDEPGMYNVAVKVKERLLEFLGTLWASTWGKSVAPHLHILSD